MTRPPVCIFLRRDRGAIQVGVTEHRGGSVFLSSAAAASAVACPTGEGQWCRLWIVSGSSWCPGLLLLSWQPLRRTPRVGTEPSLPAISNRRLLVLLKGNCLLLVGGGDAPIFCCCHTRPTVFFSSHLDIFQTRNFSLQKWGEIMIFTVRRPDFTKRLRLWFFITWKNQSRVPRSC